MSTTRPANTTSAINDALTALASTVQHDTEATLGDLDLLVKLNRSAAARYRSMGDAAEALGTDAEYLRGRYREVERYIQQVDELDGRVEELEKVVRELDEWTGELEAKVRKIAPASRR